LSSFVKCGDAVEDSGADGGEIVTAGGHSVVYTCTESGNQTTYINVFTTIRVFRYSVTTCRIKKKLI
jgi:hypothetical protein